MHNQPTIRFLIPFLFGLICVPISLFAQEKGIDMEEREAYLLQIRKDFWEIAFKHTEQTYALADSFNQELIKTLCLKESFDYPFDSLATKIRIIKSDDKTIKIYSWYNSFGGVRHDIYSFAQLKKGGFLDTLSLHVGESVYRKYSLPASYFSAKKLETTKGTVFILNGWGTLGGGHHHRMLRAIKFSGNKLVHCEGIFDGEEFLLQEAFRGDKLDLNFDQESQTITYSLYKMNEDDGFYDPTGEVIVLKWDGEKFSRK